MTLTDDELERIAIEVEHLPPDKADAEYRKRAAIRKLEKGAKQREQKIRRTDQT